MTPVEGSPPAAPLRIGVVGAGRASTDQAEVARAVGRAVAEAGAVLVCGGRTGVMEAAARGAREAGGLVVGVLPGEEAEEANPWLTLPLPTGMGQGRNILVVRFSEALLAVGGSWGTVSEMALAGKLARPLAVVAPPSAGPLGFPEIPEPAAAVAWALESARRRRENPYR